MKKSILVLFLLISFRSFSLTAPTLLYPSNGLVSGYFDMFLNINPVTGATGYQFQYDSVNLFNSSFLSSITGPDYFAVTPILKLGRRYYWRARAFKPGDTSAWSGNWSFSLQQGNYQLNQPASNTSGAIRKFTGYVNTNGDQTGLVYLFEADTTASFNSSLHVFSPQPKPVFTDTGLFKFGYSVFWRARVISPLGDSSNWSPVWKYSFYSQASIDGFSGVNNIDPWFIASWPATELASTEFMADTSMQFNSPVLIHHFLPAGSTRDTISDLYFNKYYYYKVRSIFNGYASQWSVIKTLKVLKNGYFLNPYNSQVINTRFVSIYFDNPKGTVAQLQLYSDSAGQLLIKDTVSTGGYYSYPQMLDLRNTYYAKLRYMHAKDTTPWIDLNFTVFGGQVIMSGIFDNTSDISVRPRFMFRKYDWASSYFLEIDTGIAFTGTHSSYFIKTDSFKYDGGYYHYIDTSLLYGQNYVWRVYAVIGNDTTDSYVYRFKTADRPVNYYPPDKMIGTGTSTNGMVTGVQGSGFIQWEMDSSILFNSSVHETGVDPHVADDFNPNYISLDFPADLRFKTGYYWRSRCINAVDTGSWSVPFYFVTTEDIWAVEPLSGSVIQTNTPLIKWGIQGDAMQLRFQYQIARDSTFSSSPVISLPAESDPQAALNCLYGVRYYWRARALNGKYTSDWSPVFNFTTPAPHYVGTPQLFTPASGTLNVPVAPVGLSWKGAENAALYDYEVSDAADFTHIVGSGSTPGLSALFSETLTKTKYYWHVRGKNSGVIGAWSGSFWFSSAPPSGIQEAGVSGAWNVYPNPARSYFEVECDGKFSIAITDSNGRNVLEQEGEDRMNISVSTWQSGVYIVIIQTGQSRSVKKLIVHN